LRFTPVLGRMANYRKCLLVTGETYHIFNRGVNRADIFGDSRDYLRAVNLAAYYRFANCPMRFSYFNNLTRDERGKIIHGLTQAGRVRVRIFAFCFMPNHFHFLVRQETDKGVSRFMSEFSNGYAKYLNTKKSRVGPLYQGPFRSVRIENDEQLIHVSRYIHLNPATSYLVPESGLDEYPWSSLHEYAGLQNRSDVCDTSTVMGLFSSPEQYRVFVHDQLQYARQLDKIRHLILEE